jgi:hypothetical protein
VVGETLAEFLAANPGTTMGPRWTAPYRCPVHDLPLLTAMGIRWLADITASREFEDIQVANPCCLDVDEAFAVGRVAFSHCEARLVWCSSCQSAAERR